MQLSYARFDFFASARRNVKFAEFKLNLLRRHCFITNYFFDPSQGNVDNLTIEMPLDPSNNGKTDLPLEFFICRIRDYQTKKKEIRSVDQMLKTSNCKHF